MRYIAKKKQSREE